MTELLLKEEVFKIVGCHRSSSRTGIWFTGLSCRTFFVLFVSFVDVLRGSGQNALHDFPMHIGQPEVPALELVGQALVVDAQTVQ